MVPIIVTLYFFSISCLGCVILLTNSPSFDNNNRVNPTDFFNALSSCGLHIIKEDASLI